ELSINSCLDNFKNIVEFIRNEIGIHSISILGIRLGATLAIQLASKPGYKELDTLYLIDPVVSGKRYLMELRLRRKAFFMLNKIKDIDDKVIINSKEFEDHQGYLISTPLKEQLNSLDLFQCHPMNKD